jgi:hypothetical protein
MAMLQYYKLHLISFGIAPLQVPIGGGPFRPVSMS